MNNDTTKPIPVDGHSDFAASQSGWYGVDLDGTLAYYDGWNGPDCIGEPIMPMLDRVKQWLGDGRNVKIFTARMHGHGSPIIGSDEVYDAVTPIQQWCLKHLGVVLDITNVKDLGMIQLWDDRCVQVRANVGTPITE